MLASTRAWISGEGWMPAGNPGWDLQPGLRAGQPDPSCVCQLPLHTDSFREQSAAVIRRSPGPNFFPRTP